MPTLNFPLNLTEGLSTLVTYGNIYLSYLSSKSEISTPAIEEQLDNYAYDFPLIASKVKAGG